MLTAGWTPLAALWAARGSTEWLEHYWTSESAHHRDVIVRAMERVAPFASLVEVGSHCGPNLRRLSATWPAARYIGLDANAAAVDFGNARVAAGAFEPEGVDYPLGSVRFTRTAAFGLDRRELLAADVFLSCYALAYAAPPLLRDLFGWLKTAGRIRALVLAEPLGDGTLHNPQGAGAYGAPVPEYHHDLLSVISETWPGARVTSDPIDPPADRLTTVLTVEVPR